MLRIRTEIVTLKLTITNRKSDCTYAIVMPMILTRFQINDFQINTSEKTLFWHIFRLNTLRLINSSTQYGCNKIVVMRLFAVKFVLCEVLVPWLHLVVYFTAINFVNIINCIIIIYNKLIMISFQSIFIVISFVIIQVIVLVILLWFSCYNKFSQYDIECCNSTK